MKTLAIIPARYGSTRFPGKPLAEIFDKPMIQWVYESCKKSASLDKIIIATDDERIVDCVEGFSAQAMMTSESHESGTDRCYEVVKKLAKDGENFDLILNIQGDEPFIPSENIDALIECMQHSDEGIGTIALPYNDISITENPNRVKIRKIEGRLEFYRAPESASDHNPHGLKHVGMYAYTSDILAEITSLPISLNEKRLNLEQYRWLDNGYNIALAEIKKESPSVDTPADLDYIVEKGLNHWC